MLPVSAVGAGDGGLGAGRSDRRLTDVVDLDRLTAVRRRGPLAASTASVMPAGGVQVAELAMVCAVTTMSLVAVVVTVGAA